MLPAGAPKPWGTATAPPKPREVAAPPPMMSSKLRLGFRAAAASGPACKAGHQSKHASSCVHSSCARGGPVQTSYALDPRDGCASLCSLSCFWASKQPLLQLMCDDMICQIDWQSSGENVEQACIYLLRLHLRELQLQPPLAAG